MQSGAVDISVQRCLGNHGNDDGDFPPSAGTVRKFPQSAVTVWTSFSPLLTTKTSKCCVAVLNAGSNSLWVQLTLYNKSTQQYHKYTLTSYLLFMFRCYVTTPVTERIHLAMCTYKMEKAKAGCVDGCQIPQHSPDLSFNLTFQRNVNLNVRSLVCWLECFLHRVRKKKRPRYFQLQLSHFLVDFYNFCTIGNRSEYLTTICNRLTLNA